MGDRVSFELATPGAPGGGPAPTPANTGGVHYSSIEAEGVGAWVACPGIATLRESARAQPSAVRAVVGSVRVIKS